MSNKVKRELDKIEIPNELHKRAKKGIQQAKLEQSKNSTNPNKQTQEGVLQQKQTNKMHFYKRISLIAVICLIVVSTLAFTPALGAIQEVYEKIFTSERIDDNGVRTAVQLGEGQALDETFYDETHGITVHFDRVLVDDKETKLLLTYQSEKTNLENHYIDLFEGVSDVNIYIDNKQIGTLDNVGWGSSYYNSEENKMTEALSFESIRDYVNQDIRLEIENLTVWNDTGMDNLQTKWPVEFNLKNDAISEREIVNLNKDFEFKGTTYTIRRVEYSELETRVVVSGSDTKIHTDEDGMKYKILSKLERQLLNAREVSPERGYIVNENKSGVFLNSGEKRVDPIFSKGEVQGADDEYIMFFAPVEDRNDTTLIVGDDLEIPLNK
ncbi:DUF4179 domain-containing protein [Oceanobacillus kapialis]|uniref:DUF4179 domain-containing protein n=1 Tax=Oceanobacillus kapialis TaxID=481353 RepID=A0ABW5Q345_9BACI